MVHHWRGVVAGRSPARDGWCRAELFKAGPETTPTTPNQCCPYSLLSLGSGTRTRRDPPPLGTAVSFATLGCDTDSNVFCLSGLASLK